MSSLPVEQARPQAGRWVLSFLLALVVYAGLRAWILMTAFESVAIPVYEIATIGSYSWTLTEGVPLLPWSDHYDNAGAQILTAWLGALSMALLGASYLALKLVPMAFGVVLLALVGRMLARHFSGRAALLGMLSVAIGPPLVTKYSMLAKGNHFEGLTLLFLALCLALETPAVGGRRRRAWVIATGGALGFAISMYFGAILTAVVLALAWLVKFGFVRGLRDLPAFLAGFAVGLIPFVVLNVATHGRARAFGLELAGPTIDVPEGVLAKSRSLLLETLPEAACFEPALGLPARVAESALLGLSVLSWLVVAAMAIGTFRAGATESREAGLSGAESRERGRCRRAAMVVLLAYPLGVLAVLCLKGLPIMPKNPPVEILGVRYLLGYLFFALLLIAVATDAALARAGPLSRSVGALMVLVLVGTWPFTTAIATSHWMRKADSLGYPAVHLRQYAILFHWDLRAGPDGSVDTSRMKACLQRLSDDGQDDQRSELAIGIGAFLSMVEGGYKAEDQGDEAPFRLASILLDFEERDVPDLMRGVGAYFQAAARGGALQVRGQRVPKLRRQIEFLMQDDVHSVPIAEGFGMGQQYPLLRRIAGEVNRSRNLLALVPDERRKDVLRGLARTFGTYLDMELGNAKGAIKRQLSHLEPEDQAFVSTLLAER